MTQAFHDAAHRVLVVVWLRAHWRSLLPTAIFLTEKGCVTHINFARPYSGWEEDARDALKHGFEVSNAIGSAFSPASALLSKKQRNQCRLSGRSFFRTGLKLRAYAAFVRDFVTRSRSTVVLLPEENLEYLSHVLTREAANLGVPSLVLPYTLDNPLEAFEAYQNHPRHRVGDRTSRWFARKYPHWVRRHRDIALLRLPFRTALAMQWFGFSPPDPWQNTCSFATRVLLESNAARRAYSASGIPLDKFTIVGSVVHDRMAEIIGREVENRTHLLRELELDPGKPIFLVALPPDQFNTVRVGVEFKAHHEIVSFWLEALATTGWNVVVNLHPHLKPESIDFGSWPNVRYCSRPTAEVIPLCDVFVASISATIRWAVACGKVVVNHDLYLYGYDDYFAVPGVVHVTRRADFSQAVAEISSNESHRMNLKTQQAKVASEWGRLDGKSGGRLMDLVGMLRLEF